VQIELEFFGPIGDRLCEAGGSIELASDPATAGDLLDRLAGKLSGGEALRDPHLRLAINDRLVDRGAPVQLKDGDRVAILSPFSGG
jgi:molybdopterin converting factor small subunit